ncbi:MAG: FMN-binding protein [Gammaproteobacteria bacterium]|nr:FMN-binding protein [Gammaproteobacteria bacterium]
MSEKIIHLTEHPTPPFNSAAMIRSLTLIATLSGLLVVLVVEWTRPMISENQRLAVEHAIFSVIPEAVSWQPISLDENAVISAGKVAGSTLLYAGFNATGELAGVATESSAQGYADAIRILYGYNPACDCITGIKVLKSAETPGLGDKIFTDAAFVANFNALDVRLNESASALANPITTVMHGKKSHPWEIDAISGATISSRAIGRALQTSASKVVPALSGQRDKLQSFSASTRAEQP